MIKIGDNVNWRGGFGNDLPLSAKVTGMSITEHPREKYGEPVIEVAKDLVRHNRVVFELDNGHWCYSDQIDLN